MRYAAISLTANTVGSIALFFLFRRMGLMPHLGIAVATTLGGWLNAGLLYATLVRRGNFVADARLERALPRIVLASIVMGVALWFAAASRALVRHAQRRPDADGRAGGPGGLRPPRLCRGGTGAPVPDSPAARPPQSAPGRRPDLPATHCPPCAPAAAER